VATAVRRLCTLAPFIIHWRDMQRRCGYFSSNALAAAAQSTSSRTPLVPPPARVCVPPLGLSAQTMRSTTSSKSANPPCFTQASALEHILSIRF
jgi:hypothetical protein